MNGGMRCAASPSRNVRSVRQRSTTRARKMYSAQRITVGGVVVHGRSNAVGERSGRPLAVAEAELEPVAILREVQERRRAPRIAHLVDPAPRVQRGRAPDVHDEPALGEPQIGERGPDRGPHGAARAVAAEHRGRGQAGAVTEHDTGAGHAGDLDTGPDVDPRVPDGAAQQIVEVGLVEQVGCGMPVDTGARVAVERGEGPQPRVEQPQPGGGPADPGEAVGDPGELQHPHALVVEVHRAGERPGPRVAFEHHRGDTVAGQQQRGGEPDRAGTDDDDRRGDQPRRSAVYKVRPGPNAVTTAGRPARGRPRERSASRTSRTVVDEQLPCVASTARDASTASAGRPSCSTTVSRMRGPPGCTAQPSTSSTVYACRCSSAVTCPRTWRASTCGTSADSPMRKPRSVTSHVMWSAVPGSVSAATSSTSRPLPEGSGSPG